MMMTSSTGFRGSAAVWGRGLCAVTLVAALGLSACSAEKKDHSADPSKSATTVSSALATTAAGSAGSTTSAATHGSQFHLHDGYVKAAKKGGMTAVFGTLENHGDKPVHLVGFTSSVSAKMYQIHEVADGTMRQTKDGLTVGAGQHLELKPGGYHLMLMGLTEDVAAGSTVDVTLRFADGSTVNVQGLPVRQMAAGNESYGGHGDGMTTGMPMPAGEKNPADHGAMPMSGTGMSSAPMHK